MEGDRARLEDRMLRELKQLSASTDEREQLLRRQKAEHYRARLRSLIGDTLHHKL